MLGASVHSSLSHGLQTLRAAVADERALTKSSLPVRGDLRATTVVPKQALLEAAIEEQSSSCYQPSTYPPTDLSLVEQSRDLYALRNSSHRP
jgi:hypothetical protein